MNTTFSPSEKLLGLSIILTFSLVTFRIFYTSGLTYGFYYWNTILAIIPLFISRQLNEIKKSRLKIALLLICWMLFYPNAPYLITDLFHYMKRDEFPAWVDLVIVTTGTWNGLLLGLLSLMQVEQYLSRHLQKKWVIMWVLICILLCGYGIYLGRYLRFNSWDILTDPFSILHASASHLIEPLSNLRVWSFTILFSVMYALFYFTVRNFQTGAERKALK